MDGGIMDGIATVPIDPEMVPRPQTLPEQVHQLGTLLERMARILDAQQRRIDQLEKDNAVRITVNHQQAKALQAHMKERAAQICERYALDVRISGAAIRAAIKKAVLREYGVKDLHDLPAASFDAAREQIMSYSNYALVHKRRGIEERMKADGREG